MQLDSYSKKLGLPPFTYIPLLVARHGNCKFICIDAKVVNNNPLIREDIFVDAFVTALDSRLILRKVKSVSKSFCYICFNLAQLKIRSVPIEGGDKFIVHEFLPLPQARHRGVLIAMSFIKSSLLTSIKSSICRLNVTVLLCCAEFAVRL